IYIFARYGTVANQTLGAYGIAWLLLLSGVRVVLKRWDDSDDGDKLSKLTDVTSLSFSKIWLVVALFAVFLGARLMMSAVAASRGRDWCEPGNAERIRPCVRSLDRRAPLTQQNRS